MIQNKYLSNSIKYIYALYCMICYLSMTYLSFTLLLFSDMTLSIFGETTDPQYTTLILIAIQYMVIDTIYKEIDRLYLHHYYSTLTMYIIMLIHHILCLMPLLLSYVYDINHSPVIALLPFETTNIFLQLYLLRLSCCKFRILQSFWFSFFVIRILYGNPVIIYFFYEILTTTNTIDYKYIYIFAFIFLLIANNFWFYKLNQIYNIKCKKQYQKIIKND